MNELARDKELKRQEEEAARIAAEEADKAHAAVRALTRTFIRTTTAKFMHRWPRDGGRLPSFRKS
eukprot:COSAG02_NODE_4858_length_4897_cov_2.072947_2_plen_65_part_00